MFEHFVVYSMEYHSSAIESISELNGRLVQLNEKQIAKVNYWLEYRITVTRPLKMILIVYNPNNLYLNGFEFQDYNL